MNLKKYIETKEWIAMRDFIEGCKLGKLLKEEKKVSPVVIVLAIVGVIVLIAAAAYALYRFFAPADMDDIEFEDEFDDDFFEEEEEIAVDDVFEEEPVVEVTVETEAVADEEEDVFVNEEV